MRYNLKTRPLPPETMKAVLEVKDAGKKLRDLEERHSMTLERALTAWRLNLAWHRKHPDPEGLIREGDIPF